ncbi:MAG: SusC/RagA family TonB-linked outer membrane protein [Chitinophagaceae bacterium]
MKLTLTFLLLTFLQVSAKVYSQDKITLSEKSISWEKFFDLLEKKSKYTFLYNDRVLPRKEKINVNVSALTVPQILDHVFLNTALSYQVFSSDLVVVTLKSTPVSLVKITGRVLSPTGDPLPGAIIGVKNTALGTNTDDMGNFSLEVPAGAILEVSYVGYKTQEIPLMGRTQLMITLQSLPGNINEVVVIGYGTQKKKDLTGAVSVINSSDIGGLPVGGVDQILQGKAAGVVVTASSGAPGDAIAVRIRGVGTINDNSPLYVIDGVPTENGINEISPNDIESISILKDASSAAIYGSRASNGVVLVTTKHGHAGKARLSLSVYSGVQTVGHLLKMANTTEYVNAYNQAATADQLTAPRPLIPLGMLDTLPNVNWLKEVLRPAAIHNFQLSVSGGNDHSDYIVSANYFKQDGLIAHSSFQRFNLHTAISSTLSKWFKIGTNINLSYSQNSQVGTSGDGYGNGNPGPSVVRYALFRTPATPVFNKSGQYVDLPNPPSFFGDGLNPVALANATNDHIYNYSLLGDAFLEMDPLPALKIRTTIGGNLVLSNYKQFYETWGIDRFFNSPNSLAQSNTTEINYNWTNTATYDWRIGNKQSISLLAGSEAIKEDIQALSASRNGFVNQSPNFQFLDNGLLSQQNGGNESHWALFSLFGRAGYQYEDKYLASFNFRRDGSSRLSAGQQYGNFFSGSLGWRIDKEKFLSKVKAISLLKLRASIGQLGNQQIGTYPYASLISGGSYYPFGGTPAQGYSIYQEGNPDIKWETSTQTDVGLDLGLFENALEFTADYFIKNSSNVLLNIPLPTSAGNFISPAENAGAVRNNGLELSASFHHQVNEKITFDLSGNFATLHNEVISLAGGTPIVGGRIDNNYYATLTEVGHPIGAFYLLKDEGIFQTPLEVFTHAYQGPGIQPGDVKFLDVNGDGVINEKDRTFVGSPIPKFTYGFTGNMTYQRFDLSIFFQGVYGNKIYNQVMTDIAGFYRPFNITEQVALHSWNGPGTSNVLPRLSWSGATNNKMPSTRFLEDGSYLRLKNLQIGYRLGSRLLSQWKISSVRIYAGVQNLFTITKYTGLDPEMYTSSNAAAAGDGVRAVGIDWGTYPSARTYTLGLNVNF